MRRNTVEDTHKDTDKHPSIKNNGHAEDYQTTFAVEGMTCASCVRIVERQLKKLDGIEYVSINLATEKGLLVSDIPLDEKTISEAVRKAGYTYKQQAATEDIIQKKFKAAEKLFIQALAVTIPLMILMVIHMAGVHIPGYLWMEFAAGAFVLFYTGRHVIRGAAIALTHRHTNMDTLVTLGALAAWLTTPMAILGMPVLSFGAISTMIIAFHLTGRYIENRLKYRASQDIQSLLKLQSSTARIILDNGKQEEVPVETVKPGQKLLIRTGDRIPLDASVVSGSGYIDESMVTGEPVPVFKEADAEVIGGTLLEKGNMTVSVSRVGEDTFLSKMIRLIEDAQSSRVPVQAFADRITKVFIPVVFSLAAAAGLTWYFAYPLLQPFLLQAQTLLPWIDPYAGPLSTAIFTFVASLVIACPCALGLATPMALVAGSGAAAKKGLIIKDGEAIQTAKDIDVILLDKTGTITKGSPTVVETDIPQEELANLAALEGYSSHPLGLAIISYVKQTEQNKPASGGSDSEKTENSSYSSGKPAIAVSEVNEEEGEGITGRIDGKTYRIGRPKDPKQYEQEMGKGHTVIEAAVDDQPLGFFAVADPVKEDSAEAVRLFTQEGILPVMVTGDEESTARSVARDVGITEIHAGYRPDEKLRLLRSYQKQGKTVAMVGDGINDAAALKAADVGIALGTGTDLSIESADIIIISGELTRVNSAIEISRLTFRKIRQNLFWAFMYNLIALPMAMAGLLHPAIAEAAMTFSSINVILNSMGIRKKSLSHATGSQDTALQNKNTSVQKTV